MGWLIAALGTALALGGTVAIYFGAPYIQMEWGYSEVIAGTTALSAGILAVALAAILFALGDLRRLAVGGVAHAGMAAGRDSAPAMSGREASAPALAASDGLEPNHDQAEAQPWSGTPAPVSTDEGSLPVEHRAATVVGRYEANGASYVLFSDGTIEVETETGTHRYGSMEELRAQVERQDAG